jgi:hypothetical protein
MQFPPPLQTPGPVWRRRIFVLTALLLLSGCANGDFGELRPFLVTDGIHDWVGPAAIAGTKTSPSNFELTDDERQLRDLAFPLIEPPYDRQKWYSIAGEYGLIARDRSHTFDLAAYADRLLGERYRSASSRYSHLIDDIRNDTTRLPQFFETAARVLDIDQKRKLSLAYITSLSPVERTAALRRINVNAEIISWVRSKLMQRAASYKFALERLVLIVPSQQAVETERALNHLNAEIEYYNSHSAPTWGREPSLASVR